MSTYRAEGYGYDGTKLNDAPTSYDSSGNQIANGAYTNPNSVTVKPPTINLAAADPYADPAMLAFARGAGASESLAKLAVQNQKSKIARQIAASGPAYQDSLRQGLQSIAGSAEANGMYQSGKRLQDQNDFQVGAARQQNSWLQGLQDQSNDADTQLAQQIASIQQQKAEQELQSRVTVAQRLAGLA